MPIEEALPIAAQIAAALEAAHDKGIVHRDLKPANVIVTPDGQVKVLDFGLAKHLGGANESDSAKDLSHSPTMTGDLASAGLILGTAAYMSPEQARGKAVDRRTDLWSFGCVLYEMLAGAPAFPGDTLTDVLAAVINQERGCRWQHYLRRSRRALASAIDWWSSPTIDLAGQRP